MQPYRPYPSSSSTPASRSGSFTPAHTPQSPSYEKETHLGDDLAARQQREAAERVVRDYEENQARCVRPSACFFFAARDKGSRRAFCTVGRKDPLSFGVWMLVADMQIGQGDRCVPIPVGRSEEF